MIYLDNSATTRPSKSVLDLMARINSQFYYNPSSAHSAGQDVSLMIEEARVQMKEFTNSKSVIFTSGATEANNLILKGILIPGDHLIVSSIEHKCILNVAKRLAESGIEVSYAQPNSNGVVEVSEVLKLLKPNTRLVSVMQANNETGVINPVNELGKALNERGILFHTDATQSCTKIPLPESADFVSISAHKFHGPKGVGALLIRSLISVKPLLDGGGQEFGVRSGTLNTSAILGLAEAFKLVVDDDALFKTKNLLLELLRAEIPESYPTSEAESLCTIISITLPGVDSSTLVESVDGVCISAGSACISESIEGSYVLLAMGKSEEVSRSTVRISISKYTTEEEIRSAVTKIAATYRELKV